jgi:hypothetical protein
MRWRSSLLPFPQTSRTLLSWYKDSVMKRKLNVVKIERDYRNVVFLGPNAPFNNISHGRVPVQALREDEKNRVVAYEACTNMKNSKSKYACNCEKRCVWAIVKFTREEELERRQELQLLFPLTKF